MRFDDQVVVVTGAATGIGAAIAAGFAREGATVYGLDRAWGPADEGAAGIERVECDVADEGAVGGAFARILDARGRVDVLVNDAALASAVRMRPFEEIDVEDWNRVMTNNTLAPFLCTRAVAPAMRAAKRGRVINLSSATVFIGVPDLLHYVASKGAIAVMTKALATELGRDGITVNALAPGLTKTEGLAANPDYEHAWEPAAAARCLPRTETAEDLVGAALFLAGEDAAFITGQILAVDGGATFH